MDISSIELDGSTDNGVSYKLDLFISDLEDSLEIEEKINCISSYATNIYVGTSFGRVLHYHQFPDYPNYMLISQIKISNEPRAITKMLILSGIERVLILAENIVNIFTLPELSPCHIGKLKNINDLSILETSMWSSTDVTSNTITNEKIIAFSPSKIRIVQINKDSIKMLKEINYSNAITGISASSSSSANYSNIGLIANKKNYVIIDFKETKQSTLFDYCPEEYNQVSSYKPNIIPFRANDRDKQEEYLLTICSDERTSIGMFIDSSGNATRGTLTWLDSGIPIHGIVIEWPYVLGIFEKEGKSKFIISSLVDFKIKYVHNLTISPMKDNNQLRGEIINTENEQEENKDSKLVQEININEANQIKEKSLNETIKQPKFNICKVSNINIASDQITTLFQLKAINGDEINIQNTNMFESGSLLVYDEYKIWLLHEEDRLLKCQTLVAQYFNGKTNSNVIDLLKDSKMFETGARLSYILQLLFLVLFHSKFFEEAVGVALTFEKENLLIDPLFVLYIFDKSKLSEKILKDIKIYSGILLHINQIQLSEHKKLLEKYLVRIFKPYIIEQKNNSEFLRQITYKVMQSYDDIIALVDLDIEFWKVSTEPRKLLLSELEKMKRYYSLIYIYQIILETSNDSESYAEKICDLCFQIMVMNDIPSEKITEQKVNLTDTILNQLSHNFKSPNIYAKYLLEFLNHNPDKGIEFMKSNKKKEFTSTHKSIMDELSKSYKGEMNLNVLRIEYLEYLIFDEPNNEKYLEELVQELIKEFESPLFSNEANKNNFEILMNTYSIENSLNNDTWPKISWIDYLIVNMENSTCHDYIKLYLKISELLIHATHNQSKLKINCELSEEPIYAYFSIITQDQSQISRLLEASDYSTAEYIALFGNFPKPSKMFYEFPIKKQEYLSVDNVRQNLEIIFQHYTKTDFKTREKILAIQHFVESYATKYYSAIEVLSMIPDYVPLIYIQKYLLEILINSNNDNRNVFTKKAISKADYSFSKTLIKDLN